MFHCSLMQQPVEMRSSVGVHYLDYVILKSLLTSDSL